MVLEQYFEKIQSLTNLNILEHLQIAEQLDSLVLVAFLSIQGRSFSELALVAHYESFNHKDLLLALLHFLKNNLFQNNHRVRETENV